MVPRWVDQYLGLPYETCDCWQLIRRVYREQWQIDLPDEPEPHGWQEITPGEARLGDVLAFHDTRHGWHVALVLAPGEMLHTEEHLDCIREPYTRPGWLRRLAGIYRWPKPLTARP